MEKTANGIPSGERSPSGKPWPRTGGCNALEPCKFPSAQSAAARRVGYPERDVGGYRANNLTQRRRDAECAETFTTKYTKMRDELKIIFIAVLGSILNLAVCSWALYMISHA